MSEQPIYVPALDTDGKIPLGFLPDDIGGLTPDQVAQLAKVGGVLQPEAAPFNYDAAATDAQRSAAMRAFFAAATPGVTLLLTGGKTYVHGVPTGGTPGIPVVASKARVTLTRTAGGARPILRVPASAYMTSCTRFTGCDDLTIDGVDFELEAGTYTRQGAGEQMRVLIEGGARLTLRNTDVRGSAASAYLLAGVDGYTADNVTFGGVTGDGVTGNGRIRADGFSTINGCRKVRVTDCYGSSADDNFSLLTYDDGDAELCDDVIYTRCRGLKTGARNFAIGGVGRATLVDCDGSEADYAGIIVVQENSVGGKLRETLEVTVSGGKLKNVNKLHTQNAILVTADDTTGERYVGTVRIDGVDLTEVNDGDYSPVGVKRDGAGSLVKDVGATNIRLREGFTGPVVQQVNETAAPDSFYVEAYAGDTALPVEGALAFARSPLAEQAGPIAKQVVRAELADATAPLSTELWNTVDPDDHPVGHAWTFNFDAALKVGVRQADPDAQRLAWTTRIDTPEAGTGVVLAAGAGLAWYLILRRVTGGKSQLVSYTGPAPANAVVVADNLPDLADGVKVTVLRDLATGRVAASVDGQIVYDGPIVKPDDATEPVVTEFGATFSAQLAHTAQWTVYTGGQLLLEQLLTGGAGGLDAAGAVAAVQDAGVFVPAAQAAQVVFSNGGATVGIRTVVGGVAGVLPITTGAFIPDSGGTPSDDYESDVTLRYNQANMPTASPWSWPASKGTVPIEWTNPTGGGTTRADDAFGAGKDGLTLENVAAHITLDTPATFDPSGRGVLIMSLRDLRIDNAGDPLNNGAEQRLAVLGDTVAGVRLEYGVRQAGGALNWFVKNLDGDLALEPADQPVDSAPGTWPGVEGPLVVALVLHGAASEVRVASGQGVQVVPFDASGIASYNEIDFNPFNGGIKRGLRTHRLVEHGPAGWTSGMVSAAVAAQAADIALTIGS